MANNQQTQLKSERLEGSHSLAPRGMVGMMKDFFDKETVQNEYRAMLGRLAPSFLNSYVNLIRCNKGLQECTEASLKAAIIVPATLKLSVEPSLGQAYIIPYGKIATFQIGYKGIIQLCIRSGQYETINCSEIYRDELKSQNPITGKIEFVENCGFKLRKEAKPGDVIGYYAYFKLLTGFEKSDYMTTEEAFAHARKYSKAYNYDLKSGKKESLWSTNPNIAGCKTVIKRLLSRYGVMSVEMQDVMKREEDFEEAEESVRQEIDAEQGTEEIDAEFEPEAAEQAPEPAPKKTSKKKQAKTKLWKCNSSTCGEEFEKPVVSGTQGNEINICPECLTADITPPE